MPDQGTTLIDVTAERLKEGAIEAFGRLFAQQPLGRFMPDATEVNYLPGVSDFYNVRVGRTENFMSPFRASCSFILIRTRR